MWKNIKIVAKSALNKKQMQRKIDLGADALEIQLLSEFIKPENRDKELNEIFLDLDELLNFPVESVHAPLCEYDDNGVDVPPNIEVLSQPKFLDIFKKTFELANMYGIKQNKKVKIVFHTEIDMTRINVVNNETWKNILKIVDEYLDAYKNVDICIENVLPIRKIKKDGQIVLGSGFGFDNVIMCDLFKKESKYPERFFTVLDTCHAEVSRMTTSYLNKYNGDVNLSHYQIENYFKQNQKDCGLIHLSRTLRNGMGPKNHGQPFNPNDQEDINVLKEYVRLYKKYSYNCPLVLEVAEVDYNLSEGFKDTLESLKRLERN